MVPDMRRDHWEWLERNLDAVNAAFDTDFTLDTEEARKRTEYCLDIYDSEDDFNDAFGGVYLRREYGFEIQNWEGYAACIDGKYVSYREINYFHVLRKEGKM